MGWWRLGHTGDDFIHEQVLPELTDRAVDYIDRQTEKNNRPFFLYFPLPAPHTPILPVEEFRGRSGTNPYGDFMLQVDHTVGKVLAALDRNGIAENTLIIFTSDNGCSPQADFAALSEFGHDPNAGFRGAKADIFEGGHRVPFLVRWPGEIQAGIMSDDVICLTDLMATIAEITDRPLGPGEGVDSYSLVPVWTGTGTCFQREATVHHSVNGSFAIRKGKWKLIMCPGSGGWSHPLPGSKEAEALHPVQLYDLAADPGETSNLATAYPEVVEELRTLLTAYIKQGRSTPGQPGDYVNAENWPGLNWL
jgi:arylsulfatase A-like enzyme